MTRIRPITDTEGLDADARAAFDRIVASRGSVTRPFQVLLHAPALAGAIAELGHVVRFGSHLAAADRELVTLVTGRARGCAFVWDSHLEAARSAGLSPATISALEGGGGLEGREGTLVSLVDELCAGGDVSSETFDAALALVGTSALVEVVATVAYYSMLGMVMRAFDAC